MHEIKIKIKGNGTVDTGFRERLRIGVANEINRVKFVFELEDTIEGSYHYIKFLKDDISYIYRVYNKEIIKDFIDICNEKGIHFEIESEYEYEQANLRMEKL